MIIRKVRTIACGLAIAFTIASGSISAQYGNSISGTVYGINRRPLSDINVELLDDLSRMISRTRTNGTGSYTFGGVGAGRFTVRVLPYGTDYEEQENTVEIQNFATQSASGQIRIGGFGNEQSNFNLRLRRGVSPAPALGSVFAQDVPEDARKLYLKALNELENKRDSEAQANLRSALEIFPKYYAALERLATEYIRIDKPHAYEAAEILLSIAVDVNPRGYRSWFGLAYARSSLGRHSSAKAAAQKALELNSLAPEAVFLMGSLQRHTKNYSEAEKNLLKAKQLANNTIPQIHWELALLYGNHLERYAEAAKELKLFLKAQPGSRDAEHIRKLIADFELKAQKAK